jgi:predicted Rossmann fold flavoprotein
MQKADVVVIGAGAAGLMAAIQAARARPHARVVALDGALRLGAKILIAGGGRCNVTHRQVEATDFCGSTPAAIRKVLRRFEVADTLAFFEALGVPMVEEPTGKLFPASNRASTVRDALLGAARRAAVPLRHPCRVTRLTRDAAGVFTIESPEDTWQAPRVILATGGRSVPTTGSDGFGYQLVEALGLPLTPHLFPALVPLTLPDGHWIRSLGGISTDVRLTVTTPTGRHVRHVDGALLCTHLGISGPAVLDVSRHWQAADLQTPGARLLVDWIPGQPLADTEAALLAAGRRLCLSVLSSTLPDRLGRALLAAAHVPSDAAGHSLTRERRRTLVRMLHACEVPVTGTRGFAVAEVTAGGVPLAALHLETLEARVCPGLHLCGEICDVDGRIGGFNFQWAWASGLVAGRGAAAALAPQTGSPTCGTI